MPWSNNTVKACPLIVSVNTCPGSASQARRACTSGRCIHAWRSVPVRVMGMPPWRVDTSTSSAPVTLRSVPCDTGDQANSSAHSRSGGSTMVSAPFCKVMAMAYLATDRAWVSASMNFCRAWRPLASVLTTPCCTPL